jgi:hypothetical protein
LYGLASVGKLAFKTLTKFGDSFLDPRNVVLDVFFLNVCFSETTATKEKPMPRACKPRERRERERERAAKVS